MKWYNDMSEQEKRSFQKVIAVCVVGAILILIVPMVFHTNLHSAAKSAAQIVMKVFQFSTLLIKYFLKKLHYKARGGES